MCSRWPRPRLCKSSSLFLGLNQRGMAGCERKRKIRTGIFGGTFNPVHNLVASDFEFSLPKPSYTWNTLQALTATYPDRRFTLIIGADNWVGFERWYEHDKILANHHIVVYPRKGSDVDAATLPRNVKLLNTELYEVSSTEVRDRVSQGLPIDHLVPPPVATLISQKGYYLPSP